MSRSILIRRVVGMLVALALAVLLWIGGHPADAEAKVVTRHGVAIDIKHNALAIKCKKKGQHLRTIKTFYICPRKGWFAYMRTGESFAPEDASYYKFYKKKKKALRASSRSAQNRYLPTVKKRGGVWVTTKRWY